MHKTKERRFWNFLDQEWTDVGILNEDSIFKSQWNLLSRLFVLFLVFFWALFSIFESFALYKKHQTIVLVAEDFLEEKINTSDRSAQILLKTLYFLPQSHYSSVSNISIKHGSTNESRGRANASQVILNKANMKEPEMVSVFLHEIGHVVDLGMLRSSNRRRTNFIETNSGDPSLLFYSVSWKSSSKKKSGKDDKSFVSGYSFSNPYEDFAESYDFYLLHGKEFRKRASNNESLQKRYDFLKQKVFFGKEFDFSKTSQKYPSQFFDVTILPYDFTSFLEAIEFEETEKEDDRVRRQKRRRSKAPRRRIFSSRQSRLARIRQRNNRWKRSK